MMCWISRPSTLLLVLHSRSRLLLRRSKALNLLPSAFASSLCGLPTIFRALVHRKWRRRRCRVRLLRDYSTIWRIGRVRLVSHR
jgi:hypothetical protein